MGYGAKCFIQQKNGAFKRISMRMHDELLAGRSLALRDRAGHFVRMAYLLSIFRNRKPVTLSRMELSLVKIDRRGFVDQDHQMRGSALAVNFVSYGKSRNNSGRAELNRFHRWIPTPEEKRSLEQLALNVDKNSFIVTKDGRVRHRRVLLKDEEQSHRRQALAKTEIRKIHNRLINDFTRFCRARLRIRPVEEKFDLLLRFPGFKLLIEAKSTSLGHVGRHQIREAIGQLFDYRYTNWGNDRKVSLAVLLPEKPARELRSLLESLDIGVIWQVENEFAASERVRFAHSSLRLNLIP